MMQTGCRVQDHVSGGKFDVVRAVSVLDDEFAAFVLVGSSKKQGGGQVGTNAVWSSGYLADRVVDVRSKDWPPL